MQLIPKPTDFRGLIETLTAGGVERLASALNPLAPGDLDILARAAAIVDRVSGAL